MTKTKIALSSVAVMLAGVGTFMAATSHVGKLEWKWANIPPILRNTTNRSAQASIQNIQARAMLMPQPYTNSAPTNLVCEIYPFVNWKTNNKVWYLITLDTNLNSPSDWKTEKWVTWSTQRVISLPISKALGAYFYKAYPITNRAFRFGNGKPNPPD